MNSLFQINNLIDKKYDCTDYAKEILKYLKQDKWIVSAQEGKGKNGAINLEIGDNCIQIDASRDYFEETKKYAEVMARQGLKNQDKLSNILNDPTWFSIQSIKKETLYVQSEGNESQFIQKENKEPLPVKISLKRLCENDSTFIRVLGSFAINKHYAQALQKRKGSAKDYELFLRYTFEPIPVGRKYLESIKSLPNFSN